MICFFFLPIMCLLKSSFDQNLIMINYKFNVDFNIYIILKMIQKRQKKTRSIISLLLGCPTFLLFNAIFV
jgi:hypothetical protein